MWRGPLAAGLPGILLWLLCFGAGFASDGLEDPTVTIGIREDAPPFAWQDGETAAFRGYLNDLCVEATTRAGFHFKQLGISAAQRAAIIDGDPVVRTVPAEAVTLDVLCDPTTITLARLQRLIRSGGEMLTFSPIVFVANGSYVMKSGLDASNDVAKSNAKDQNAFSASTDAEVHKRDCVCLRKTREDNKTTCPDEAGYFRAGYVTGTTAKFSIALAVERDRLGIVGTKVCPVEMPSHRVMVKALCDGGLQYAFGDTDIAQFYGKQSACQIKPADHPLSYEPYALLVSDHTPGFRPRFIAALYEMFSDQTVAGRFGTYFPGLTKSSALGILFRINSIPGMRDLPCVRNSAQCNPQGGRGGVGGEGEDEEGQSGQKRQRAPWIALAGGDHGAGAEDQGRDIER